jgi:tRNA nucleotidyltransferase (CCA-adding enzyme)
MRKDVPEGVIPEPVLEVCRRIERGGYRAWVVGGGLRDVLMERAPKDWDLATSATPEQVMELFRRVVPTGLAHGTVTVILGDSSFEVTTLRGEGGYSDGRRPDEVFFITDIERDLARRDFTVNALAYDPLQARLIDPFGGLDDMAARLLRTVGRAEERFGEDGLRVLRAARFVATLEMRIEAETKRAISSSLDAFRRVSPERVREEWMRAFAAKKPSAAFDLMRETGILDVTLPELVEQHGCGQNRYHAYDVWTHTMECMDACDRGPVHRLAGLLHDIGKPRTRERSEKTGDYTFFNHEQVGARMADTFLRAYKFSGDEREHVVELVRHHLVCYASDWTDAAVRRFVRRVGPERVEDLLALAHADVLAKGRPVDDERAGLFELRERIDRVLAEGAAMGTKDLAVDGKDVMQTLGVPPGRIIGQVLEELLQRVTEKPELNEREALLQEIGAVGALLSKEPTA